MELTRRRTMALLALAAFAVTWLGLGQLRGDWPESLRVPIALAVLFGAVAAAILIVAWPVRQYIRGKRRWIEPLRAARTVALAKACALAGAAFAGVYGAVVARALTAVSSPVAHDRAICGAAAAGAAAVLAICAWVAERWCRLPPADTSTEASPG
jgi:hypothetical protein